MVTLLRVGYEKWTSVKSIFPVHHSCQKQMISSLSWCLLNISSSSYQLVHLNYFYLSVYFVKCLSYCYKCSSNLIKAESTVKLHLIHICNLKSPNDQWHIQRKVMTPPNLWYKMFWMFSNFWELVCCVYLHCYIVINWVFHIYMNVFR